MYCSIDMMSDWYRIVKIAYWQKDSSRIASNLSTWHAMWGNSKLVFDNCREYSIIVSWRGLIPLLKLVQPKACIQWTYVILQIEMKERIREQKRSRMRGINELKVVLWSMQMAVVAIGNWCSVQSPYLIHLLQSSQPLIGMCAKLLKPG